MKTFGSSKKKKKICKRKANQTLIGNYKDIAIIGMAGRFPGADNYYQFWENLLAGKNSITEITPDRFSINDYYSPDSEMPNKSISKWGGLLDTIDYFDAAFFNISPREAVKMDPQQRLLLEETWHCIEDAAIELKELQTNKTSVYVGVMAIDYQLHMAEAGHLIDNYECIGNYEGILANRLSYVFNFTGESQSIDAACASSLVSIHDARRSLVLGESDYAIAAGVSVICHPWKYISFSKAHMLSPDGQCKTFDAEANGYVPGEGVGVLLMCSLEKAQEKGYHIYGIIKGSAVKHTGKSKTITAPRVQIEKQVIEDALKNSGVAAEDISYIEAHGTGTSLGDPIEIEALTQAFHTEKKQYCKIGSVKTNIGHLEAAAGIASVIKVLVMMQHRKIPKTLNIKTVNPIINFKDSPFYLADTTSHWTLPSDQSVRYAGISSFGFGGVNAHLILEEYINKSTNANHSVKLPFLLSAKSENSLYSLIEKWQQYITTEHFKKQSLADICFTLATTRQSFGYRVGGLVSTKDDLVELIHNLTNTKATLPDTKATLKKRKTIFSVPSQPFFEYVIFRNICNEYPILKKIASDCDNTILTIQGGETLLSNLMTSESEPFSVIKDFLQLYIITKAVLANDLEPYCLVSHKIGVLVEAVLIEMIDFKSAIEWLVNANKSLKFKRPKFRICDLQQNNMIERYHISRDYCKLLIHDLEIEETTRDELYQEARQLIINQYTFKKYLAEWDKIVAKYGMEIGRDLKHPNALEKNQSSLLFIIIFVSLTKLNRKWDLTGHITIKNDNLKEIVNLLLDQVLTPADATTLLLNPIDDELDKITSHIQKNIDLLDESKSYKLLHSLNLKLPEISDPNQWLNHEINNQAPFVIRSPITDAILIEMDNIKSFNSSSSQNAILSLLFYLWQLGFPVDWRSWCRAEDFKTIALPLYPFDKQHFWLADSIVTPASKHPLIDVDISTLQVRRFEKTLTGKEFYLADHVINGDAILPGVAYIEMVRSACEMAIANQKIVSLKNLIWAKPIKVTDCLQRVVINLYPDESGAVFDVATHSQEANEKTEPIIHSQGKIVFSTASSFSTLPTLDLPTIKESCFDHRTRENLYAYLKSLGFQYGAGFQVIQYLLSNEHEAIAELQLPSHLKDQFEHFILHPSLLDGALQTVLGLQNDPSTLYLPFSIGQIDIYDRLPTTCYAYVTKLKTDNPALPKFLIKMADENGKLLLQIKDFTLRAVQAETRKQEHSLYYYHSIWQAVPVTNSKRSVVGSILVFDDENSIVNTIDRLLPDQNVIQAKSNDVYEVVSNTEYHYNPLDHDSYTKILDHLKLQKLIPKIIIYRIPKITCDLENSIDIKKMLDENYYRIFNLSQSLFRQSLKENIKIFIINEHGQLLAQALSGFAKTLHLENTKILAHVLTVAVLDENTIKLLVNEFNTDDSDIYYDENAIRHIKCFQAIPHHKSPREYPLIKKQGVYLITGGAGGLGLIFARYLAEHYKAKIILTGRSALQAKQQFAIDELTKLGAAVLYRKADVTKFDELKALIKTIKSNFGVLNGIIHAAGVLQDAFILKKSTDQSAQVLAPKIDGTLNLDELTQSEKLDFFIMFSSMTAILGNVGQCDYAYANGFMDAYAQYRDELVKMQKRYGQSISINWPLWAEGGMQIDKTSETWLEEIFGVTSMTTKQGLNAFNDALYQQLPQFIVLPGNQHKIEKKLGITAFKQDINDKQNASPQVTKTIDETVAYENIKTKLIQIVSNILHMDVKNINYEDELSEYGLDSVSTIALANQVNSFYKIELTPAILFEHTTLKSFVEYLITLDEVRAHYTASSISTPLPTQEISPPIPSIQTPSLMPGKQTPTKPGIDQLMVDIQHEDIAVIGMSGIFPGSPDLNQFWQHLIADDELISEIPKNRWDWEAYYGKGENKTKAKWGGFIDDIDKFDAQFFNISPAEAQLMDPQQRILLETVWKTIEDAGFSPESVSKITTGLFIGIATSDYRELTTQLDTISSFVSTGMAVNSILANRISYILGLRGPSEVVDTACSSSLVAIHNAIKAIHNGDCELAIAGGVNALITPTLYLSFSNAGMLCTDGRCKTFDENANGYVRGEGVGAILLKPISKALADGDHIYGVIKGSAVNHGGHVKSLTVPNPNAQSEVIMKAMERAQVDINTISYIETHGTGTSLGDPIEINGLKKAFHGLQEKQNKSHSTSYYCGLGAVKTNIGHLEGAAGIAGVIKILLAMQHGTLPGIRHFKKLNPYIEIKDSPFYIIDKTCEWKHLHDPIGGTIPRRAGVSSFGFGGANAHVVIEEAPRVTAVPSSMKSAYLITLSAKTANALKQKIADLDQWIVQQEKANTLTDSCLEDISYTLNTGRNHFQKRCALVVNSITELKTTLTRLRENHTIDNAFLSPPDSEKSTMRDTAIFKKIFKQTLEELNYDNFSETDYRENLLTLANFYANGYTIDFAALFTKQINRKISLPTYPFERTRHWIPETHSKKSTAVISPSAQPSTLHPLIDTNTSTFENFSFNKLLTSKEFYLCDHLVNDVSVLPGVAYLEMARVAATLANPKQQVKSIKNVIWMRPITVTATPQMISIVLSSEKNGLNYEVISASQNPQEQETTVYAQGKLLYDTSVSLPQPLDLTAIKNRCTKHYESEEIYAHYKKIGLSYGPSFQVITALFSNENEILSKLNLPGHLTDHAQEFLLHPSLMDGALQTLFGIKINDPGLFLPFSISQIDIFDRLPHNCYAYVIRTSDKNAKLPKFQIQLLDEKGNVLVHIKDFIASAVQTDTRHTRKNLLYFEPKWIRNTIDLVENKDSSSIFPMIIINDAQDQIAKAIRQKYGEEKIIQVKQTKQFQVINQSEYHLNQNTMDDYIKLFEQLSAEQLLPRTIIYCTPKIANNLALDEDLLHYFYSLFYLSKVLVRQKLPPEIQLLCITESGSLLNGPLLGFVKTLHLEYPKILTRVISIPPEQDRQVLLKELHAQHKDVQYDKEGLRYIKMFESITMPVNSLPKLQLKKHGVYLITGGAGGLGLIFARFLAEKYQAKLALIGRSDLNDKQSIEIETLRKWGSDVVYLKADITCTDDVKYILDQIKLKFGTLNGVIHSAGVVRDSFIIKKSADECAAVLAPKITGLINLDTLTKSEPLDFFVVFSSISAVVGNMGQCDYAYANGFMDTFAIWRESLKTENKRSGTTISINWPLWETGGMKVDAALIDMLVKRLGITTLSTNDGIEAFLMCLAMNRPQLLIASGDSDKIEKILNPVQLSNEPKTITAGHNSLTQLENELIGIFSKELKIKAEDLDVETQLSNYGMNSLLMIAILDKVEQQYGQTVEAHALVEYATIREFALYLSKQGIAAKTSLVTQIPAETTTSLQSSQTISFSAPSKDTETPHNEKIAIIGMAGRFPGSPNIEIFWENLRQGKLLITEVPDDRWPLKAYFSSDKKAPHKSYSKWGGFMQDVEWFAADYFGVTPADAIMIDPPQRLLLEVCQELLDRSGYHRDELNGKKVGVFIGADTSHYPTYYEQYILDEWRNHRIVNYIANMASARIADFYNFVGPAYTIDTACSSSLVATHQACRSILSGESEYAVAGGAEVLIGPENFIDFSKAGVLSDDNKSYVFDERAKGFVLGEAVGLVLLKKYDEAVRDGDIILGVILGSAINNDGHTPGLTVPSLKGQQAVIEQALAKSDIKPNTINFYEAHGTGTLLGDPIEIKAMTEVYQRYTDQKGYCAVGSVKSNIGHTLRAAGIASLIKVLLAIQHQTIPPTINCDNPHPRFNFSASPFYPATQAASWAPVNGVRRAAISSFGFGGTNCHLILEEAPGRNFTRIAKPLTKFQRQRYWLADNAVNRDFNIYKNIFKQLRAKEITVSQALSLPNTTKLNQLDHELRNNFETEKIINANNEGKLNYTFYKDIFTKLKSKKIAVNQALMITKQTVNQK